MYLLYLPERVRFYGSRLFLSNANKFISFSVNVTNIVHNVEEAVIIAEFAISIYSTEEQICVNVNAKRPI